MTWHRRRAAGRRHSGGDCQTRFHFPRFCALLYSEASRTEI